MVTIHSQLCTIAFFVLAFFSLFETNAQYIQDIRWQTIPPPNNGVANQPFFQPTLNDPFQQAVFLYPEVVYLEYNCYYMRDICVNAQDFINSNRGQQRNPRTLFGYDLNTGKKQRAGKRRAKSCPTGTNGWKTFHTCPETTQNIVMRHDGPWPHKALEPGTTMLNIMNQRDNLGRITEYSKIRYSCDEFPPASWVEGGSGLGVPGNGVLAGNAFTRCAGMRCGKGANGVKVKSEQDWQGTAHGRLREELQRLTRRRQQPPYNHFPYYNPQTSVILFNFRLARAANGVAARVYTYADPALTQLQGTIDVTQVKRSVEDTQEFLRWSDTVNLDELIASGKGTQHLVLANDTLSDDTEEVIGHMHIPDGGLNMGMVSEMQLKEFEDSGNEEYDDDQDDEDEDPASTSMFSTSKAVNRNKTITVGAIPSGIKHDSKKIIARHVNSHLVIKRNVSSADVTPLLKAAEPSALEKARKIVEAAITESAELNAARYANPRRNSYGLRPGSLFSRRELVDEVVPPLLVITDEIADAAALVSEADAVGLAGNRTVLSKRASGTYWMEHLARKGTVPWGNDASYKVYRNVADYGAVGDGVTDDTKAIKLAMNDGKRCGEKCNGSTIKNAIVYFPPGTYRISTTIPLPFGTQVVGDANAWPTLVATRLFIGLGVLSTDEYTGGGIGTDGKDQQWFVNTANFYRQIRNIRIDITATRAAQKVSCLHYQVAQATSLQDVELIAAAGGRGIFAENGSGGAISDVTFKGGEFGLYGGNQQFTAQRLTFDGCSTGVQIIWDWGWVWKSITMRNIDVGFRLLRENTTTATTKRQTVPGKAQVGNIGSASFIDSSFTTVNTAILIAPPNSKTGSGSTGVIVENVSFQGVGKAVADTTGATLLAASDKVGHWALGPIYSSDGKRSFSMGKNLPLRRQNSLLDSNGGYFEREKPQYAERAVGDFVHVKDFGARGDGKTDDSDAFQNALWASQGKILYVDAGSYILTKTITIPMGSKIVGETWSQLVGAGSYFGDASKPKVLIKVGKEGDVGDVEIQDILFTSRGHTPGLIVIEWNIKARSPGSAGLWDSHVRLGGALGTELTPAECPALTSGVNTKCHAASLMMHITPRASGYFENMWLWVADHMIDDPDMVDANNTMVQTSIYVGRGLLVESQEPVWLYGTSSEHAVFYQYNFNNALNIFAGMIQTESPYYQPTPKPPAPFEKSVGVFSGDPDYSCKAGDEFSGCDESWAVIIQNSGNIFIAGGGLYSWFSTYTQDCIDTQACQKALVLMKNNYANVRFQHFISIGAKYMAVQDGVGILAIDNLNVEGHPRWSQISVFDAKKSNKTGFDELLWISPEIWKMDQPSFTCSSSRYVKIPPWTGATSVIDYPLITVSQGAWTSTITKAPLTVTQMHFEVVTLVAKPGVRRRQEFMDFWPRPAPITLWPAVVYTGPDGIETTTSPIVSYPTPPSYIGPGAPPPPNGSWPPKPIRPVPGSLESPIVDECGFWDPFCLEQPWMYEGMPGAPEDPYDERGPEDDVICPEEEETSSSTTTTTRTTTTTKDPPTTTVKEPEVTESPFEIGNPKLNQKKCYNGGRITDHVRLFNAISSYCKQLNSRGPVLPPKFFHEFKFPFSAHGGNPIQMEVVISLDVFDKCKWDVNEAECTRYLKIPVDSCDCKSSDWKTGGVVENNCLRWRIDPNNDW